MCVCVYDNPSTMSRECWRDGHLIRAYQMELLCFLKDELPPEHLFFGANAGDWKEGQLVGDSEAMCKHTPCPSGYVQWCQWAKEMHKTHMQEKCPGCGRYKVWVRKRKC